MTTFDRREEAFENMFAHDEAMHFLAEAHRTKLLAAWVAEAKGKTGAAAESYATELLAYSVANGGEQAMFERVRADLGGAFSDADIRERMAALMAASIVHVKSA